MFFSPLYPDYFRLYLTLEKNVYLLLLKINCLDHLQIELKPLQPYVKLLKTLQAIISCYFYNCCTNSCLCQIGTLQNVRYLLKFRLRGRIIHGKVDLFFFENQSTEGEFFCFFFVGQTVQFIFPRIFFRFLSSK